VTSACPGSHVAHSHMQGACISMDAVAASIVSSTPSTDDCMEAAPVFAT
jgi:hypothetical protein